MIVNIRMILAIILLAFAALITLPGCISRVNIGPIKEDGSQKITVVGTPVSVKSGDVEIDTRILAISLDTIKVDND